MKRTLFLAFSILMLLIAVFSAFYYDAEPQTAKIATIDCEPPFSLFNGVHEVSKAIRSDILQYHYIVTRDGRAWRLPFDKCAVIIQEVIQ